MCEIKMCKVSEQKMNEQKFRDIYTKESNMLYSNTVTVTTDDAPMFYCVTGAL